MSIFSWTISGRFPPTPRGAFGYGTRFESLTGRRIFERNRYEVLPRAVYARAPGGGFIEAVNSSIYLEGGRYGENARVRRSLQRFRRDDVIRTFDLTDQPFGTLSRAMILGFGVFLSVGGKRPTFAVRTRRGGLLIGRSEGQDLFLRDLKQATDVLASTPRRAAAGAQRANRRLHGRDGVIARELTATLDPGLGRVVRSGLTTGRRAGGGSLTLKNAGGETIVYTDRAAAALGLSRRAASGGTEVVPAFAWNSGPRARFRDFTEALDQQGIGAALRVISGGGAKASYIPGRRLVVRRSRPGADYKPFAKFRRVRGSAIRGVGSASDALRTVAAPVRREYALGIDAALGGVREGRP